MKMALFAVLVSAILLFGCASQQAAPQQNATNATQPPAVKNTTPPMPGSDRDSYGCIPSAGYTWCDTLQKCIRPWEETCGPQVQNVTRKKLYTCSLTLTPETIYAGGATDVGYSVATQDNVDFTFDCGSEVREISTGGLTSGERLCTYPNAGILNVNLYADGAICAQKTLTVLPKPSVQGNRNCSVSLINADVGNHYYELTAYFDGFSPSDNITWKCDYLTAVSGIETAGNLGISRQKTLTCHYTAVPMKNYIEVYVGGMLCGNVTIPV